MDSYPCDLSLSLSSLSMFVCLSYNYADVQILYLVFSDKIRKTAAYTILRQAVHLSNVAIVSITVVLLSREENYRVLRSLSSF